MPADKSDLSADEVTVLLIAGRGEPMMPIGRWKGPTESLVAKGFMKPRPHVGDPTGHFNNYITALGSAELAKFEREEDALLGKLIEASSAVGAVQRKARASAEQIAVQIVELAEMSAQATGDDKVTSLRNWAKVIFERALEKMQ